jgi:GT2 family glycosyltransferase
MLLEIVSASRSDVEGFAATPLGTSLARLRGDKRLQPQVTLSNAARLPDIYNARIESGDPADILVFMHDDMWIEDFYFTDRIIEGLTRFDIIGVAGNSRIPPGHKTWAQSPETNKPDLPHLRGGIGLGPAPLGRVRFYGPTIGECELLDGVFIAARKSALVERKVRFDPRFDFHFYDLDFSRTARKAGLRLGVWPIAMTHRIDERNEGSYSSPGWHRNLELYQQKWPAP